VIAAELSSAASTSASSRCSISTMSEGYRQPRVPSRSERQAVARRSAAPARRGRTSGYFPATSLAIQLIEILPDERSRGAGEERPAPFGADRGCRGDAGHVVYPRSTASRGVLARLAPVISGSGWPTATFSDDR
jgi:hypothetical protein